MLTKEKLKKIKCPNPHAYCFNHADYKVLHEHPADIDGVIYYHLLCLKCEYQFAVTDKELQ